MFWPIRVTVGFPGLIGGVKCYWSVVYTIAREGTFYVIVISSKMVLGRMRLDYLQALLAVFLLEPPHYRDRAEAKDAGIGPAIQQHHFSLQFLD